MSPGLVMRARTGLITVAAASVALVASSLGLAVPAAGSTSASTIAATSPAGVPLTNVALETADDVQLQLAVSPQGIVQPGETLTLSVTVTNTGSKPLPSGELRFAVTQQPLTTRAAVREWAAGATDSGSAESDAPEPPVAERVLTSMTAPAVAVGSASAPITVEIPAESVGIAAQPSTVFGVSAALELGDLTVTRDTSTLVWSPVPASTRSGTTVVLPITAPTSTAGLIDASDLQTFTSPNGILTRQLDGASGHPSVALAIDPRILVSIRALGTAAPDSAVQWLQRLLGLSNETFPLQFGDADASAQAQAGVTELLQPASFDFALDASRFDAGAEPVGETPEPTPTSSATATPEPTPAVPTLERLLAWPYTTTDVVWPADNRVRASDLTVFANNALSTTIVSSSNVDAGERESTVGARRAVEKNAVLVADSELSMALGAAATATNDVAWSKAMGRVNAELAAISNDGEGGRNLLMTLPRNAWPATGLRLAQTLSALDAAPWSTPVALSELMDAPSTPAALADRAEPKRRIATVNSLLTDERDVGQFSSVLTQPELLTGDYRATLLTLLAAAWVADLDDWYTAVTHDMRATIETMNSVAIASSDTNYNLVANEGSIPVTVSNGLPYPVKIVLRANPSNGRLAIEQTATKTIAPQSRAIVFVPVKAQLGNGRVQLTLQLESVTGVKVGTPAVVPVMVNADWEGIGAIAVGAFLVLLFGFGLVRNIRRRRRERALDALESDSPDTPRG